MIIVLKKVLDFILFYTIQKLVLENQQMIIRNLTKKITLQQTQFNQVLKNYLNYLSQNKKTDIQSQILDLAHDLHLQNLLEILLNFLKNIVINVILFLYTPKKPTLLMDGTQVKKHMESLWQILLKKQKKDFNLLRISKKNQIPKKKLIYMQILQIIWQVNLLILFLKDFLRQKMENMNIQEAMDHMIIICLNQNNFWLKMLENDQILIKQLLYVIIQQIKQFYYKK